MSGSGISWAICKSAPRCRQITTPAPHHSVFLTGRMPFLPPNQQCVSALKALTYIRCILLLFIIIKPNLLFLQVLPAIAFISSSGLTTYSMDCLPIRLSMSVSYFFGFLCVCVEGCAGGRLSMDVWQDLLDCVTGVDTDQNQQTSHVESLSSSQVRCSAVL